MKLEKRKREIINLRNKGLTYEEIAKKYKITGERVRQILTYKIIHCQKHDRDFIGTCSYCLTEKNYINKIKEIVKDNLENEIERLAIHSRNKSIVMQRTALIKQLRDKFGLSFQQIGRLLNRDRSSIINLYKK